jgi:hypothetical protein
MTICSRSMYSLFATAFDKLHDCPLTGLDASGLRGCSAQAAVNLAEVVIREIHCDRSLKVFQLFPERIR